MTATYRFGRTRGFRDPFRLTRAPIAISNGTRLMGRGLSPWR
jgi:hypothetical protein